MKWILINKIKLAIQKTGVLKFSDEEIEFQKLQDKKYFYISSKIALSVINNIFKYKKLKFSIFTDKN